MDSSTHALAPLRAARCGIASRCSLAGCAGHTRPHHAPTIAGKASIAASTSSTTRVDRAALKPVAKGYKQDHAALDPHRHRQFLRAISNTRRRSSISSCRASAKLGLRDTGRFLFNTTLGIAGLFDVATPIGLEANDEDFGQTLAVWGVGSGPYLTLPFFGPSTVRDAPSRMLDFFFDPLTYIDMPWEAEWGMRVLDARAFARGVAALDPTLQRTYDPYAFIRDAWVQQREFAIFDGNPPPETLEKTSRTRSRSRKQPDAAARVEP